MDKKIRWTSRALQNLSKIITYLKSEWPQKVSDDFEQKLKSKLSILVKFPLLGPESEISAGYRKYIITKHNTIYYRIKNDQIFILNIYDTRQRPKV